MNGGKEAQKARLSKEISRLMRDIARLGSSRSGPDIGCKTFSRDLGKEILTVTAASTPPATPPARSETNGVGPFLLSDPGIVGSHSLSTPDTMAGRLIER